MSGPLAWTWRDFSLSSVGLSGLVKSAALLSWFGLGVKTALVSWGQEFIGGSGALVMSPLLEDIHSPAAVNELLVDYSSLWRYGLAGAKAVYPFQQAVLLSKAQCPCLQGVATWW